MRSSYDGGHLDGPAHDLGDEEVVLGLAVGDVEDGGGDRHRQGDGTRAVSINNSAVDGSVGVLAWGSVEVDIDIFEAFMAFGFGIGNVGAAVS